MRLSVCVCCVGGVWVGGNRIIFGNAHRRLIFRANQVYKELGHRTRSSFSWDVVSLSAVAVCIQVQVEAISSFLFLDIARVSTYPKVPFRVASLSKG